MKSILETAMEDIQLQIKTEADPRVKSIEEAIAEAETDAKEIAEEIKEAIDGKVGATADEKVEVIQDIIEDIVENAEEKTETAVADEVEAVEAFAAMKLYEIKALHTGESLEGNEKFLAATEAYNVAKAKVDLRREVVAKLKEKRAAKKASKTA